MRNEEGTGGRRGRRERGGRREEGRKRDYRIGKNNRNRNRIPRNNTRRKPLNTDMRVPYLPGTQASKTREVITLAHAR